MNIAVRTVPDGIALTLGKRDGHLGMSTVVDREQAEWLHALLGAILYDEDHYQEWLAKEAGLVVQVDQGGEVIPMHTQEEDLA